MTNVPVPVTGAEALTTVPMVNDPVISPNRPAAVPLPTWKLLTAGPKVKWLAPSKTMELPTVEAYPNDMACAAVAIARLKSPVRSSFFILFVYWFGYFTIAAIIYSQGLCQPKKAEAKLNFKSLKCMIVNCLCISVFERARQSTASNSVRNSDVLLRKTE